MQLFFATIFLKTRTHITNFKGVIFYYAQVKLQKSRKEKKLTKLQKLKPRTLCIDILNTFTLNLSQKH